ncbi:MULTISPECIES: gluconokinase [Sphingobium]|uniref:Gluconokinase n=2 Tax=Sphingobium TaxID=165695 RepID=K9DET0_SPHYA|nr:MULTISPECIES: gluconokinase [Sphingobium]EKU75970.1 thermoresistant glucokinase family carbohydrate kinase [Sphingobium yanoikuyae ATCC 51230]WQE05748.1 gluconokinase [Sphingobium yanoikuyae]SHL94717.1 gluconate kinase, SKI family [Sphingobium sp. YR657]
MPISADPAPVSPKAVGRAIIVMGVSGCGKSTLGAMLAQALDCPFLEGDSYHSAAAVEKMRGGEALTDADRWPWLDRLGAAIAGTVAAQGVAVAACSALKRTYRDRLRAAIGVPVHFILLDNDRDELLARLGNRPGHYMPASLLDSQLATLEPPLPEEGAMILTTNVPASELRDRALAWLG